MCPRRMLGAVDAAAGEEAGEVGDSDAKDLLGQDMVDALFEVGDLGGETFGEPAGDLPQEDARFGARIEES